MITGSENDIEELRLVFKNTLKFEEKCETNITRQEVIAALTNVRDYYMKKPKAEEYYCFVCVIMSHGNKVSKFKIHNGFVWFSFLVFNATFNNISVISWRSVLLVDETGENHRPVASH